ncbi:MHC class I polypeptide-related sequence A isoform X1 [Callithrix jacchus]
MGLVWVLLFLAGVFSFAAQGAAAEPHSLRYNLTVLSWNGSVQSGFLAEGHLDGQLFLHCDRQKCPAGPQGQWAEAVLRAEISNTEIEDLRENEKDLKMTLAHEKGQKGALHSLQEIRLCEIHEDGSTRGFQHFYSDGNLFLSQNLDTREWNVSQSSRVQILPINITKVLEENAKKAGAVLADCLWKLRRYLASGAGVRRTVPPMVNVTRLKDSDGNINVTCWASGFYPQNITLTWRQDGVSLSHDAQHSEGVLPDGNGTYQTWVTISICQGEEQNFTCYMEHSGNHSTHPVPPGKVLVLESQWPANLYVLAAAAPTAAATVIGIILCWVLHCRKKKTSSAQHPGKEWPAGTAVAPTLSPSQCLCLSGSLGRVQVGAREPAGPGLTCGWDRRPQGCHTAGISASDVSSWAHWLH